MGDGPIEWEVYGDAGLGEDAVTFCMLGMYEVQSTEYRSIEFLRMNAWLSQKRLRMLQKQEVVLAGRTA